MSRSAASDQGLQCLPVSLLWDVTLKWANDSNDVFFCGVFRLFVPGFHRFVRRVSCFSSFCMALFRLFAFTRGVFSSGFYKLITMTVLVQIGTADRAAINTKS